MRTLQHPFFITCFTTWGLNQFLESEGIYIWPLFAYLDNLLCFPLTLTFILTIQRLYFQDQRITIPIPYTLFAVAAFTLCFELVLPIFREVYTADVLDVVAYSMGAMGFHLLINKPLAPQYM